MVTAIFDRRKRSLDEHPIGATPSQIHNFALARSGFPQTEFFEALPTRNCDPETSDIVEMLLERALVDYASALLYGSRLPSL
ncbi:MAG TPA: hypothetical protein VH482_27315, partial [Thermomicrobiales bacterium]